MTAPEEAAALTRITATFPQLDAWGERLRQEWRPDRGSQLAYDENGWPPNPVGNIAWASLGSAWDHLQALRVLIEARQLFSFAAETLREQQLWAPQPQFGS
jgi:hypothetical protein